MSSNEPTQINEHAALNLPGFELLESFAASGQALGNMGDIWRAHQVSPSREVIIKILSKDRGETDQYRIRFDRETFVQGKLGHPNIVPIFAAGETNGVRYFAMEFMTGGTLRNRLDKGKLDPVLAISIAIDIASALEATHNAGFVHRDVKPANILFRANSNIALLTDFGIAGYVNASSDYTRVLAQLGTPGYMSPEQYSNFPAQPTDDLYSLGIVLFEMLTGKRPLVDDHKRVQPLILPRTLGIMQPLLQKMLAPDIKNRYTSAAALVHELLQIRSRLFQHDINEKNKKKNRRLVPIVIAVVAFFSTVIYLINENKEALSVFKSATVEPLESFSSLTMTPNALVLYQRALKTKDQRDYERFIAEHPASALADAIRLAAGQITPDVIRKKAESGDVHAQVIMSEIGENGIMQDIDIQQAIYWSERAAKSNHPLALTQHALLILEASADAATKSAALRQLEYAADAGLFIAQTKLGTLLLSGEIVEKDILRARDLFKKAADQGDPYAMNILAQLYEGNTIDFPDGSKIAEELRAKAENIFAM